MRKALVIVRNTALREKLEMALWGEGFRVSSTADGETALRRMHRAPVDLAIADMMIRGKDGIEVIKDIQREFPDTRIIALSGSSLTRSEEFQTVVSQLGVERFFAAPFNDRNLVRAAIDVLSWKPAERVLASATLA